MLAPDEPLNSSSARCGGLPTPVEASAIPFLSDTFPKARKLWAASKSITAERLTKQGIRLLYGVPWPSQGFYTKTPVSSVGDFKGVKMRTYSAMTSRMAELMGAIPAAPTAGVDRPA